MLPQVKDIFEARSCLYVLVEENWKKVGTGFLILTYNPYHPTQLILKLNLDNINNNINNNNNDLFFIWQIKPLVKSKGPTSWVFKGLNTKTKEEQILAARFAETNIAEEFQQSVNGAISNSKDHLVELNNIFGLNDEKIKQSLQTPWMCELCTTENGKQDHRCTICLTPRSINYYIRGELSISNSLEEAALPPLTPQMSSSSNPSQLSDLSETAERCISLKDEDEIYDLISPPKTQETFDFNSSSLKKQSPTDDSIYSIKKDFVKILNHIDSNLNDQDAGIKLFDDLKKVAKRLLRSGSKYRVLDLRNPLVKNRLLGVEGVDIYLKHLGFEANQTGNKMICPENQPPKSIVKTAMEVCEEFKERAKRCNETGEGMPQSIGETDEGTSPTQNTDSTIHKQQNFNAQISIDAGLNNGKKGNTEPTEKKESDEYTIRQMIFQITNPESRDDKTQEVLLLCHKPYCKSIDLLNTMIERFKESGEDWQIKLKLMNMLRQWIRNFYVDDFEREDGCMDTLEGFLELMKENEDNKVQKLAHAISQTLKQQELEYDKLQTLRDRQPRKNLLVQMGAPTKFKFSEADPRLMAEQISMMDFKLFKNIQKRECLGQAWKKKDRDEKAPNIMAMIDQFNKMSKWIQVLILTASSLRERTKILKRTIKIAKHLLQMRNFSSCCAIKVALMSNPIYRLKACWSTLPKKHEETFARIQKIFDSAHNWSELRKLHQQAPTPAILHIGMLLQDIVFIDEGNVERKDGIINFSRLMRLYEKIEMLFMYQQEGYSFKEDTIIQQVLEESFKSQEKLNDEHLWQFSSDVKEKDNKVLGWKE